MGNYKNGHGKFWAGPFSIICLLGVLGIGLAVGLGTRWFDPQPLFGYLIGFFGLFMFLVYFFDDGNDGYPNNNVY